ncbi:hypothetical protein SAMN04244570_2679 [Sporosarcina newyorkensis]|uniref:Nucleotidyltransferase domain-containing protein n=1 Tax=Sporosarcina newyorkensis TaxID=759851 RepID=A0A1T4YIG2_9BACL|nr:hypothetical protein SAMN04244570_2679 [Sporosarcina newyorkensis]
MITLLRGSVNNLKKENVLYSNLDFYLFGSLLYTNSPNDIDLIIVYNKDKISIQDILLLRKHLYCSFFNEFKITLDITLLTKQEEKSLNFIQTEKAISLL